MLFIHLESPVPASLVGVFGPHEKAFFPVREELTIGRDAINGIQINDPSLSRRHCSIVHDGGVYLIRDLGSHNGTHVNGKAVSEQVLDNGDTIKVGSSVFQFASGDGAQPPIPADVSFDDDRLSKTVPISELAPETAIASSLPPQRLVQAFGTLLTIATRLRGIRNAESLLWQFVGVLLEVLPADRVAVLLGETADTLEPAFAWDRVSGPGKPVRVSRTVVKQAFKERHPIIMNNLPERLSSTSILELEVCSVLCVPVVTPDKQLGVIYADNQRLGISFDGGHQHLLSAIGTIFGLALENTRSLELLDRENQQLKAEVRLRFEMVGDSPLMHDLYRFVAKVAPSESNVLIHGESGTGKELVARAIHRGSPRADQHFVAINCAALTETLLESELFGYEKGAFTGALAQKRGYLEAANGGTVFLDEIGEMALSSQAKLLRVLQEREVVRVGGTKPIKVNIRIVAATNKSLAMLVKEGKFREDLYYRLNVVAYQLAPLRERREDIPLLAQYFVEQFGARCARRVQRISNEATATLMTYDWPGNVRELQNAIEHAVVLGSTTQILRDDLPESLTQAASTSDTPDFGYHAEVARKKKELIVKALEQSAGNFTDAAKLLGIHPNYLHRLVRILNLRSELKRSGA
jgi:two-component system, NtrC family, response regulator HydG